MSFVEDLFSRASARLRQSLLNWDEFWFGQVSLTNLALMRIVLGFTMVWIYSSRYSDWKVFYGAEGLLPRHLALEVMPQYYEPLWTWFFWSDSMAGLVHAFFILGLIFVTIGLGGRWVSLLTWVLHIGFLHRNYAIAFGADVVACLFLLYLSLTQATARYSLDQVLSKKLRWKGVQTSDLLSSVFYRLIQIQLCVIYFYSGLEKLKGPSWWDGTALWTIIANSQMVIADLTWMKSLPLLIVVMTFGTMIFEIYFPALVWTRFWRKKLLVFGFFFHLGIGLLMALFGFSGVMLSAYCLFLNEQDKILARDKK